MLKKFKPKIKNVRLERLELSLSKRTKTFALIHFKGYLSNMFCQMIESDSRYKKWCKTYKELEDE